VRQPFLLVYIFSLSSCTNNGGESEKKRVCTRHGESEKEKQVVENRDGGRRVNNNSIFFFFAPSATRRPLEQMCCFLCRLYFSEPLTIYVTNGENKPCGRAGGGGKT